MSGDLDDFEDLGFLERMNKQFAETANATRERLAFRMIADGQFPSAGWTIGEETKWEGNSIVYSCWPIPPDDSKK